MPETLAALREANTAELLSPQIAERERQVMEALDELKGAREAMQRVDEHLGGLTSDQLSVLRQDNPTNAGVPKALRNKAMSALDSAHQEALLNAQSTIDPVEAGKWLQKAQEVEDQIGRAHV